MHLEELGLLNTDSPIHLACLYLVYHTRIQKSLDHARQAWNHHSIRTARHKTPTAIYQLSREHAINAGYWTGDPGDSLHSVDNAYGVDGDAGFLPPQDEMASEPTAPRSDHFDTTAEEKAAGIFVVDDEEILGAREALGGLDLDRDDGNWGIDVYCTAVTRLHAYIMDLP